MPPLSRVLAELPAFLRLPLSILKDLEVAAGIPGKLIVLIFRATLLALLQELLCSRKFLARKQL